MLKDFALLVFSLKPSALYGGPIIVVYHYLQSMVQILEIIHKLLPHVAAINLLIPQADEATATITTGNYYTWVESDHPYKPATVTNMR